MIVRVLLLSCLVLAASTKVASATRLTRLHQWLTGLRSIFEDCPDKLAARQRTGNNGNNVTTGRQFIRALTDCASGRALLAIDDILEEDVIPVIGGLNLVKLEENDPLEATGVPLPSANISLSFGLLKRIRGQGRDIEVKNGGTWQEKLTSRLARVLKTHAIKIDVERLGPTIPDVTTVETFGSKSSAGQVESRGRRRRRRQMQMIPIIMMGVLLMGTVLIPMGFQFLAVLGGKALILAKMALMLSSIQGLKKVATNGVNYGLYHSPEPVWHERSTGAQEVPYTVAAQLSGNQHLQHAPHHHQTHHHAAGGGGGGGGGYIEGFGPHGHFARRSAVQPT